MVVTGGTLKNGHDLMDKTQVIELGNFVVCIDADDIIFLSYISYENEKMWAKSQTELQPWEQPRNLQVFEIIPKIDVTSRESCVSFWLDVRWILDFSVVLMLANSYFKRHECNN